MSSKSKQAFRGLRKTANISRRAFAKAAVFSGKVENKANRIIHGTDNTISLEDKIHFEKFYYKKLPEIVPIHPSLPLPNRGGYTTILIPSLQKSSFFGGTATALVLAALIAKKRSQPLRVVETIVHGKAKSTDIVTFFKSKSIKFASRDIWLTNLAGRKHNHYGYLDIHPDDLFIASAWWDAYLLDNLPIKGKYIYLIQDYEPIFYNNSDHSALAESTYLKESFIPVLNTKLMLDFMKSRNYSYIAKNGIFFEPAVNLSGNIGKSSNGAGKKKLFVYGRPSVDRNMFFTALDVLNNCFNQGILLPEEWDCFMAGEDKLGSISLSCGVIVSNLGKMDLSGYYRLAPTIDIAISLMLAPHPSYPPLELSTSGAAVVTTKYETKDNLNKYNGNLICADPTTKSLTEAVRKASEMSKKQRNMNASKSSLPTDWKTALSTVIDEVTKRQP